MKYPALVVLSAALFAGNVFAVTGGSLSLSGGTTLAPGQAETITEDLDLTNTTSLTNIDTVIGFDPTDFSVSNFSVGSTLASEWSAGTNSSPSSGVYDYFLDYTGEGEGVSFTSGSVAVLTFTLTALENAAAGVSDVLILAADGTGGSTEVITTVRTLNLNPAPSSSYNSQIDLAVNVSGSSAPEPASVLLLALPLAGLVLVRRRRLDLLAAHERR